MRTPLNKYELAILREAQAMPPGEPTAPWQNRIILSAAGVIAGGWDNKENVIIISVDGYSLNNPLTGERLARERDSTVTLGSTSKDYLFFTLPESKIQVSIFGISGGDGIHLTSDGWQLDMIYPWWPRASVIIRSPFIQSSRKRHYLERTSLIELKRLDGWLRCGFSPSGKNFMILGSAGAEIFSR